MDEVFDDNGKEYFILFSASIAYYFFLIYTHFTNKKNERLQVYEKHETKVKKERKRIATEMHDDLGADLSNLMFKLKMYQASLGNQPTEDFQEIEQFTKTIITKVNETIWTLNSDKDNLLALSNFILKYVDDLFNKNQLKLQINNFETLPEKALSIESRRNIFQLFKHVLNHLIFLNIANNLLIDLKLDKDTLLIALHLSENESHPNNIEFPEVVYQEASLIEADMNYYKTNNRTAFLEFKIKIGD